MIDIVSPQKNEKEFIEVCEELGNKGLVFIYNKKEDANNLEGIKTKLNLYTGLIADFNRIKKIRQNSDLIVVKSSDKDRQVLEKSNADIIFDLEYSERKDFIHHKASGLNQVLCKLASKRDIMIGFSFSCLLNSSQYRKAELIGRMMQNIILCRKFNVKTAIASFATNPYEMRSEKDLETLFTTIGMHPKESKDALTSVEKRLTS